MSSAVGSGSNPQTLQRLNAAAANGGPPGEREWAHGGRIRALLRALPIGTFLVILANFSVYIYELTRDEAVSENSICVQPVVTGHQFHRIFSAAWFHLSIFHIFMNMLAFFQIGSGVEDALGTLTVIGHQILFPACVGVVHIGLEILIANIMNDAKYFYQCAAGYSGVIFAYLVLECGLAMQRGESGRPLLCIPRVPIFLYPIAVLAAISFFLPNISFVGHLSGIIVGVLYCRGMLLVLTLPRQWVLALQHCLPTWLTSRPGWRNTPEEDPFKSWHPAFCRSSRASFCPDAPNMDGPSLRPVLNLCLSFVALVRSRRPAASGAASPGGHQLGGARSPSRLVVSPSAASAAALPSSSSGARPASPSLGSPDSPSSIELGNIRGFPSPTTGSGQYARLEGDEPEAVADDVEAQLLNGRAQTDSSASQLQEL